MLAGAPGTAGADHNRIRSHAVPELPPANAAGPNNHAARRDKADRPNDWRHAVRAVLRGLLRVSAVLAGVAITVLYAIHFTATRHGGAGIPSDALQAATLYGAVCIVGGLVDVVLASHFRESVQRVAADRHAEMAELHAAVEKVQAAQVLMLEEMRQIRQQGIGGGDSAATDEMLGRVEEVMARVVAHAQYTGYAHAVKDLADPGRGVYRLPARRQPGDPVSTGRLNER